MRGALRSTNLRFNLDKELQRKAWDYLQKMDKKEFKSYSHAVAVSVVDYFERYYRNKDDPYFETREREQEFIGRIVNAVEESLNKNLPIFLAGWVTGMTQNAEGFSTSEMFQKRSEPLTNQEQNASLNMIDISETEIDWDFLGE